MRTARRFPPALCHISTKCADMFDNPGNMSMIMYAPKVQNCNLENITQINTLEALAVVFGDFPLHH